LKENRILTEEHTSSLENFHDVCYYYFDKIKIQFQNNSENKQLLNQKIVEKLSEENILLKTKVNKISFEKEVLEDRYTALCNQHYDEKSDTSYFQEFRERKIIIRKVDKNVINIIQRAKDLFDKDSESD
jgi:hypothetical protein